MGMDGEGGEKALGRTGKGGKGRGRVGKDGEGLRILLKMVRDNINNGRIEKVTWLDKDE